MSAALVRGGLSRRGANAGRDVDLNSYTWSGGARGYDPSLLSVFSVSIAQARGNKPGGGATGVSNLLGSGGTVGAPGGNGMVGLRTRQAATINMLETHEPGYDDGSVPDPEVPGPEEPDEV